MIRWTTRGVKALVASKSNDPLEGYMNGIWFLECGVRRRFGYFGWDQAKNQTPKAECQERSSFKKQRAAGRRNGIWFLECGVRRRFGYLDGTRRRTKHPKR
jgi:hypothetical protein